MTWTKRVLRESGHRVQGSPSPGLGTGVCFQWSKGHANVTFYYHQENPTLKSERKSGTNILQSASPSTHPPSCTKGLHQLLFRVVGSQRG